MRTPFEKQISHSIKTKQLKNLIEQYCQNDAKAIELLTHPEVRTSYWQDRAKALRVDLNDPSYQDAQGQPKYSPLEIFMGEYCYAQALIACDNEEKEEYCAWLQRGKHFRHELCERALAWEQALCDNQHDCQHIEIAMATEAADAPPLADDAFFERLAPALHYHQSAALLMVAKTALLLKKYYQNKIPEPVIEIKIERCNNILQAAINAAQTAKPLVEVNNSPRSPQSLRRHWFYHENALLLQLQDEVNNMNMTVPRKSI